MASNLIFFGWNRPNPGREQQGAELYREMLHYLSKLEQQKTIQSYESILLNPNGGDLGGFFLIRGESTKLDAVQASDEWQANIARSLVCLDRPMDVRGATGEEVRKLMGLWTQTISGVSS